MNAHILQEFSLLLKLPGCINTVLDQGNPSNMAWVQCDHVSEYLFTNMFVVRRETNQYSLATLLIEAPLLWFVREQNHVQLNFDLAQYSP